MLFGAFLPAIFLVIVVILGLLFPGYSHIRDYVSELGAVDSPIQNVANYFGFLPMGILLILFAIGLYRVVGRKGIYAKIGSILLIISGILLAAVGFFPCDAGCFNFSTTGETHEFLADWSIYIAGAALLFFAIHALRGRTFSKTWAYLFFSVGIAAAALGFIAPEFENTVYGGLVQRIAISIPLVFMGFVAFYLYKKIRLRIKNRRRRKQNVVK